ncbi:unnamed protein product, partial [Didymodactylos carnosus]
SHFRMDAGNFTKGLYAALFKTKHPKANALLIFDTEGLLSIEKSNEEYHKKLTFFAMVRK